MIREMEQTIVSALDGLVADVSGANYHVFSSEGDQIDEDRMPAVTVDFTGADLAARAPRESSAHYLPWP